MRLVAGGFLQESRPRVLWANVNLENAVTG
jgi:hypothetical protein